ARRDEEDPPRDPDRRLRARVDPGEPGGPPGLRQVPRGEQGAPHRGRRGAAARDDELDPEHPEGLQRAGAAAAAAGSGHRVPAAEERSSLGGRSGFHERRAQRRPTGGLRSRAQMMESKAIWMNGELVPFREAKLHFLTPALHYGVAAFEGIRCYKTARGPAVFRLHEHIERLVDSAHIMGWRELPFSVEELVEAC